MEDLQSELVEAIGEDTFCRSEDGKYRYLYSPAPDRKYRYWLDARLCENPRKDGAVLFIMLNPGTEEGKEEGGHKTRTTCEELAADWGYGVLWTY